MEGQIDQLQNFKIDYRVHSDQIKVQLDSVEKQVTASEAFILHSKHTPQPQIIQQAFAASEKLLNEVDAIVGLGENSDLSYLMPS